MKTELLFSSFPFISSEGITLSQMQPTDTARLAEVLKQCGLSFNPSEYMQTAEAGFLSKRMIELGFYRSENPNDLLGTIKVEAFDNETNAAALDFCCLEGESDAAALALAAIIRYLFQRIELKRLYAVRTAPEKGWCKILEHCGFTLEGQIRQCAYDPEKGALDQMIYGLLKEEYTLVADGVSVARRGALSIIKMTGQDYEQMAKWLSDERVLKYYEGRDNPYDLQKVIEKFQPLVTGKDETSPCIIRYEGKDVGYIQFYPILEELAALKADSYQKPYGVDLFIGERDCRNKGLGPKVLRLLSHYLLEELGADVVIGDPQVWNLRSVGAFAAAGFHQVCILPEHELHEGKMEANVIMHRVSEL